MNDTSALKMKIKVQLLAFLRKYAPDNQDTFEVTLEKGGTIKELLVAIGIPSEENKLVLVNGRHADDVTPLKDGDTVDFLTPIEGG